MDAELSISFVTEDEIADLHRRYLQQDGPTDVLSFPLDDEAGEDGLRVLGDVVIAPAVAARNNPDDPGCRAPAAARPRDLAPAGARPHGAGGPGHDVGAAGALFGGAGPVIWLWVLVAVLVILGSVLAIAEASLTRMSRVRALALVEEGRRNASVLARIEADPPRYLNAVYLTVMLCQNGSAIIVAILAERIVRGSGRHAGLRRVHAAVLRPRGGDEQDLRRPAFGPRRARGRTARVVPRPAARRADAGPDRASRTGCCRARA